jgi:hypothetical protein
MWRPDAAVLRDDLQRDGSNVRERGQYVRRVRRSRRTVLLSESHLQRRYARLLGQHVRDVRRAWSALLQGQLVQRGQHGLRLVEHLRGLWRPRPALLLRFGVRWVGLLRPGHRSLHRPGQPLRTRGVSRQAVRRLWIRQQRLLPGPRRSLRRRRLLPGQCLLRVRPDDGRGHGLLRGHHRGLRRGGQGLLRRRRLQRRRLLRGGRMHGIGRSLQRRGHLHGRQLRDLRCPQSELLRPAVHGFQASLRQLVQGLRRPRPTLLPGRQMRQRRLLRSMGRRMCRGRYALHLRIGDDVRGRLVQRWTVRHPRQALLHAGIGWLLGAERRLRLEPDLRALRRRGRVVLHVDLRGAHLQYPVPLSVGVGRISLPLRRLPRTA